MYFSLTNWPSENFRNGRLAMQCSLNQSLVFGLDSASIPTPSVVSRSVKTNQLTFPPMASKYSYTASHSNSEPPLPHSLSDPASTTSITTDPSATAAAPTRYSAEQEAETLVVQSEADVLQIVCAYVITCASLTNGLEGAHQREVLCLEVLTQVFS